MEEVKVESLPVDGNVNHYRISLKLIILVYLNIRGSFEKMIRFMFGGGTRLIGSLNSLKITVMNGSNMHTNG